MAISVVEEFELAGRGGVGGFNKDDSDNFVDMKPEEKLILNADFLKLLAKLKVASEKIIDGKKHIVGGTITLAKEDIPDFDVDQGLNGACHMLNKEFVALQIPFYAKSYSSDEAEVTTNVGKRGKKRGVSYTIKEPDGIRIHRISEEFDLNKYAADGSTKCAPTTNTDGTVKKGSGTYQEPTEGMKLRAAKWISENGAGLEATLDALGIEYQ